MKSKLTLLTIAGLTIFIFVTSNGYNKVVDYVPKNKYKAMGFKEMKKLSEQKYLVLHQTDMFEPEMDADRLSHSFDVNAEGTAAHWVIDNDQVIQKAPLDAYLYHVGGYGYSDITNSNSLGIEMCVPNQLDADGNISEELNIKYREEVYRITASYIRDYILPQFPDIQIVSHYMAKSEVNGWNKNCPSFFYAREVPENETNWERFLELIYNPKEEDKRKIDESIFVDEQLTFDQYFRDVIVTQFDINNNDEILSKSIPIMGYTPLNVEMFEQFILSKNPNPKISIPLREWLSLYDEVSKTFNINPNVPITQSMLETGFLKFENCIVLFDQNNYSGHGATGFVREDGTVENGTWFKTPRDGITAQIAHLFGYASVDAPPIDVSIDDRFNLLEFKRGMAPNVYALAKNSPEDNIYWASDTDYGEKIMKLIHEANTFSYEEKQVLIADVEPNKETIVPETVIEEPVKEIILTEPKAIQDEPVTILDNTVNTESLVVVSEIEENVLVPVSNVGINKTDLIFIKFD